MKESLTEWWGSFAACTLEIVGIFSVAATVGVGRSVWQPGKIFTEQLTEPNHKAQSPSCCPGLRAINLLHDITSKTGPLPQEPDGSAPGVNEPHLSSGDELHDGD